MTSNLPLTATLSTQKLKLSASYSVQEFIIPQGNMEKKMTDFLERPTSAYFTTQKSFMSVKCTEEKVNEQLPTQTNYNLHYKGERYSGQEAVNCFQQCT